MQHARDGLADRLISGNLGQSRRISGNLGESRRISRRARARCSRRRAARRRRRRGRPRPGGSRQPSSFTGMDTRASGAAAARQVRASGDAAARQVRASGGRSVRLQAFDRAGSAGALFRRWFGRRGLRRSSISRAEIVALPCMLSSASRRPGRRCAQRALLPVGRRGARSVARAAARRLREGWGVGGWGGGGGWRGGAGARAVRRGIASWAWHGVRCAVGRSVKSV